jgi:kynureninase
MISLAEARGLDATDPLRGFRDRFHLPDDIIYLDGNSLGPLPLAARDAVRATVHGEWGNGLIRSWNDADWIGAPARVGAKLARLIGAAPGEAVVADSTSVDLFKLIVAALRLRPDRPVVLTEVGNFPTDLYVAEGAVRCVTGARLHTVEPEAVEAAIDAETAVVVLTHVHYKTARRRDMKRLTALAHATGALVVWDLSHSVGAIPLDLKDADADFAVGCGYKFLNGGPGAPAFMFAAERLHPSLASPISGWMGHAEPFAFSDAWRPAAGIERLLAGTPPILGLAALEAGVDLMLDADMATIAAKSAQLFDVFKGLMDERLAGRGFTCISPVDAAERGSHIAFSHPNGFAIMQALIARGVIGDYRRPDILRFGLTPLYLSYADVWRAVDLLAEIMASEAWRTEAPEPQGGSVT